MKPYLCGPINGCTDAEANNWRDAVTEVFPESINPMKRDYRGKELTNYREIVDLDKRDIRGAEVMLVNYDKPSVGTSMEIFYAWQLGIPVVVWADKETRMSPWMLYHSTAIVHSLAEVVAKLKEIA